MTTATASQPATLQADNGDLDTLYEVVHGQRVEVPPMGVFECFLATELAGYLGPFVKEWKKGRVVVEALFRIDLAIDLQRRPDVAFVSFERWPASRQVPSENAWDVVPDLAVEVVSKTNTADEIMAKMAEYFRAGVQVVWVVYPRQALVQVYTSLTSLGVVDRSGVLDGAPVLPEFRLPLTELFPHEATFGNQANGPLKVD